MKWRLVFLGLGLLGTAQAAPSVQRLSVTPALQKVMNDESRAFTGRPCQGLYQRQRVDYGLIKDLEFDPEASKQGVLDEMKAGYAKMGFNLLKVKAVSRPNVDVRAFLQRGEVYLYTHIYVSVEQGHLYSNALSCARK